MTKCPDCEISYFSGELFCGNCGGKLQEVQESLEINQLMVAAESNKMEQDLQSEKNLSTSHLSVHKASRKRKIITVTLFVSLVGSILIGSSFFTRDDRLAKENISQAFSEKLRSQYYVPCETLVSFLADSKYADAFALAESSKAITDAGDAQNFVATKTFPYGLGNELRKSVSTAVAEKLEQLYAASNRDEKAAAVQKKDWESQWETLNLSNCNLSDSFTSKISELDATSIEFTRVESLANSKPWYPNGFSQHSSELAYKWYEGEADPCESECSYWAIDVISKSGCSSISVTIEVVVNTSLVETLSSSSGSVQPGEKVRLYVIKNGGFDQDVNGRLESLSCA